MTNRQPASAHFDAVAEEVMALPIRPEVEVHAGPGRTKLAPYGLTLTANVAVGEHECGDGKLLVLHDPAGQETWRGTWRVALFTSAELDQEMVGDPLLVEIGWTWVEEALGARDLAVAAFGGTVTRTASQSFGVLADRPATGELEIRASWTPVVDAPHPTLDERSVPRIIREHVAAWMDLLELMTGLEPLAEGVAQLRPRG
jgi:hypothetical protein